MLDQKTTTAKATPPIPPKPASSPPPRARNGVIKRCTVGGSSSGPGPDLPTEAAQEVLPAVDIVVDEAGVGPAVGSDGDPADKIASCEFNPDTKPDDGEPSNATDSPIANSAPVVGVETANTALPPFMTVELAQAIEECRALQGKLDAWGAEKWSVGAAPVLAASLRLLTEYTSFGKSDRDKVRELLKQQLRMERKPNAGNAGLIAIYLCVGPANDDAGKAKRKEWSRFAPVVNLAASMSISPQSAADWLTGKTLTGLGAEWRELEGRKSKDRKNVRKARISRLPAQYKHLAAALLPGAKFQALAKAELLKAEQALIDAIARETSNEPVATAVASTEVNAANA